MASVKLTEFKAKTLLVADYSGNTISATAMTRDISLLKNNTSYVIEVDQGVKNAASRG